MGDSYAAEGIQDFAEAIQKVHPGIFVYLARLNENDDEDRRAGWVSGMYDVRMFDLLTSARSSAT